ncbi:hypothetical protein Tco_1168854 [Tanacetum coccineum]
MSDIRERNPSRSLVCFVLGLDCILYTKRVVEDEDDEEMEMEWEDEDDGVNDNEDEAEVINAYEEVDPLNRPPPTSDEETEFAPPVVPIVDADDEPIPTVIQFGHNFHVGESSSTRDLLDGNSEVFAPGPKTSDLESVHGRTKKLEKQMFDRYKTERKMAKKFKEDEFCMNRHEYDITTLDTAVRENRSDHSKMKKFVLDLSRQFKELKEQNRRAELLSQWEAGVRGRLPAHLRFWEEFPIYTASAPRADDPYVMVRDASMAAREDDDDDITAPRDPQTSEPRGSLRDSQYTHQLFFVLNRIMPPKGMFAAAISKLVADEVAKALEADRAARTNLNVAGGSGGNGGQGGAPPVRECSFAGFMKCGPTQFHGNEGAVELCRWFEKTESVFGISECAERSKVKFAAATLQGRALTWWNSQVAYN